MKESLTGKKILITGASGFIGSHLITALQNQNAKIHAISRQSRTQNNKKIRWFKADIADRPAMRKIFEDIKPDIIFHLASEVTGKRDLDQVDKTFNSNLVSTLNILILAVEYKCRRIITVGSMEEPDITKSDPPSSPYAAAKWASTAYTRMFHALYNTPVVTAKLFMVYGPDQKDTTKLIPYVTRTLLNNQEAQLSSGKRIADWIYVGDVVDALLQIAVTPGIEGKIVEIGSGQTYSIRTIVEKLVNIIKPQVLPKFGIFPDRKMEQLRPASVKETQKLITWKPETGIDEGLRKTVGWYMKLNGK